MSQIKKKFIANNAVDETKILLNNNGALRAKDENGVDVDVLKIDTNGDLVLGLLPQVGGDNLATEQYVDDAIAAIPPTAWGDITGTLSNQTDLQAALNAKANQASTYTKTEVDDLLDTKADLADLNAYIEKPVGPTDGQVLTYDSGSGEWVAETPASAPVTSVAGKTGAVTLTAADIGYVNTTSGLIADDVQEAIDEVANLIATLPDPIVYKGTWNASTNTPALSNSDTGVTGNLYRISVAGTQDFGAGPISFDLGDSVVNNGTVWEKWDHSDQVLSVNGQTGAVVLGTDEVAEGVTNLYFTDTRAKTAAVVNSTAGSQTDQAASVSAMKSYVTNSLDTQLANYIEKPAGPTDGQVLTYDSGTGEWVAETPAAAPVTSVNGQTGVVVLDTDDVSEGSTNLYFTDSRAKTAAVVNSMAGTETDQAPSVSSVKSYVATEIDAVPVNNVQRVTLSAPQIAAKAFALSVKMIESSITLTPIGGILCEVGVDYVIDNTQIVTIIDFTGLALDGILEAGDKLVITGNV